jgi:hypothetical protein
MSVGAGDEACHARPEGSKSLSPPESAESAKPAAVGARSAPSMTLG